MELWIDCSGFPGYQVSSHGRVRNMQTGRILKPFPDRYGYLRIVESAQIFSSIRECAEFLGVEPTHISRCLTGSRKGQKIHGYHIEYV